MFGNIQSLTNRHVVALLTVIAIALTMVACQPEETVLAQEDTELVDLDAQVVSAYEEVDAIAFEAMEVEDASTYGRIYGSQSDMIVLGANCPTITNDTSTKILTIDFGTSCLGNDGRTRSGQIIIDYTRRLYWPGATKTITLQNYEVDGIKLAGSRTYTNLMTSFQDTMRLNVQLVGGQAIFLNGDTVSRDANLTRTWVRGANPAQDEFQVTGSASGIRRNGQAYTITINDPLTFRRPCIRAGIGIPVAGTKTIQRTGKSDIDVDFGDGTCNRLVTFTVGTQSKTIRVTR